MLKYKKIPVKHIFLVKFLCITILGVTQAISNATNSYMLLDDEQLLKGRFIGGNRKPRFLTFHTTDSDIAVEMQLSVPFLTIPVKKTIDGTAGLMDKFQGANLNLGALGLAGFTIFASIFILPAVFKLLSVESVSRTNNFGRAFDHKNEWLDRLEHELQMRGIPPKDCAGRALCWLVQQSNEAFTNGNPNSVNKIINGLTSNEWLLNIVKDTTIQAAILHGYADQNCSIIYSDCKISQTTIMNIIKKISGILFSF